jgi:hypothetical protein
VSTKPLFVNGWEVAGISSAEKFFLALPEILPLPVNLCFEGTSISPDALALFASNAATHTLEIRQGTIQRPVRAFRDPERSQEAEKTERANLPHARCPNQPLEKVYRESRRRLKAAAIA